MKRKLNDVRGETLVEVLCAILIGSLSVALLFSMVMASGNMDRSAKAADKIFNESLSKAEAQADPEADSGVTVTNTASGNHTKLTVTFYGGEGALSYALPKETPP